MSDDTADGNVDGTEDGGSEGLTYAEAGVDIADSEAATAALVGAVGEFEGDYAGLVDIGDRYLALAGSGRSCSSRRRSATTPPSASTASR